jgi:hypothetical protein
VKEEAGKVKDLAIHDKECRNCQEDEGEAMKNF